MWNKRDPADPHLRFASHKADPIGCSPSTVIGNFLSVTQEYQPRRDTLDSPNASLVHFYQKQIVISFITRGDITWQESSQCVTESSPSVQTCRLSVVRDVQRSVASRSRHNSTHQSAEPSNAHNLYNPPLSLVHLQTRGLIPRYTP